MPDSALTLTPALSVGIAAFAALVALYGIWATRKHNRLTVQPRLTTFTKGPDKGDEQGTIVYKVGLRNSGLGPAIIKKFEILVNGVAHEPKQPDDMRQLVHAHLEVDLANPNEVSLLRPGYVMAKDEEITIAHVGLQTPTKELMKLLDNIHLRVTFESGYGVIDCYETTAHHDGATDLSDLRLAVRLFWQRLKIVAFNRVPLLKLLR